MRQDETETEKKQCPLCFSDKIKKIDIKLQEYASACAIESFMRAKTAECDYSRDTSSWD